MPAKRMRTVQKKPTFGSAFSIHLWLKMHSRFAMRSHDNFLLRLEAIVEVTAASCAVFWMASRIPFSL